MQIEFLMTDSILIAKMTGEIDHHNAKQARSEIDGTFTVFQSKHIILDFSKVTFMDSSGIGVIMGRYNVVNEKGGSMVICGCSEYVRTILFMSGIFTIVKECENISEGIALIRSIDPECKEETDGECVDIKI